MEPSGPRAFSTGISFITDLISCSVKGASKASKGSFGSFSFNQNSFSYGFTCGADLVVELNQFFRPFGKQASPASLK